MDAIQTKKLVKTFGGVNAIDGLSVSVPKGEVVGLVGPNGSGKTTLTNVLTGVHGIDAGSVVIMGEKEKARLAPHEAWSLGITRTFQNVRVFEQISVLDNVLISVTPRNVWEALFGRHHAFYTEKAKDALTRVGLWEKRNENAANLSYGQRKLLEIARALAVGADIILFDEPFAGLFPEMVKLVSEIIKELRAGEKTVLLIEHDMAVIRELCDRVIVMDAGKLLAEGKPEDVLSNPKVIEAYLGV